MVLLTKFSNPDLPDFSAIEHPQPDPETPPRAPKRGISPYREFLENTAALMPNSLRKVQVWFFRKPQVAEMPRVMAWAELADRAI